MKCWKDSVQLTSVCQTFDMTGVTGVTGDMIGDMIGMLVSCRRLDIGTAASACTHVSHFFAIYRCSNDVIFCLSS